MEHGPDVSVLKSWIETSLQNNTHTLAAGYQGKTLEYDDGKLHLVIKVPHGRGIVRYLHTLMLRHEYRVYQKLTGFEACPECYGLVDNTYLVLEYINAKPIRERRPDNPDIFFSTLLTNIKEMHALCVAHMDLKKKDNLLVTVDQKPCIIDFGAAVIYRHGFHPVNHFWYRLAQRFDYNAWIKHKYHNNMHNISNDDMPLYQRTSIERYASTIKSGFQTVTRLFR